MSPLLALPAFDRLDLVSEPAATWVSWELPRLASAPGVVALRWIEQVSPVFSAGDLRLSVSLSQQTIGLETPTWPCSGSVGLVTRVGLPTGAVAGIAVRPGPVRLGLSVAALSSATWVRPDWTSWVVLPGVGIGIGRDTRPKAPWMR